MVFNYCELAKLMIFQYLYTDMSLKRTVILSILSVSTLVALASTPDGITAADTIRFDDGAWYCGQIADSLFNGYGKMVYTDSTVYEGEWKDGLWEGQGLLSFPDGDSYKGAFSQHQFSGYGTYQYADGASYEGYWENGMFNGSGTMYYADGSIYAGEWIDDRKDGIGVFYEYSTGALLKGYFRDDRFIGSDEQDDNLSYMREKHFEDPHPYYNRQIRPDSCWHFEGDVLAGLTYGTNSIMSLHTDFQLSKRYFAGFSLGCNMVNHKIGQVSVTYDDETGEKITLIGWDWYPDEIMTENTYTVFKLSAELGVSWGWFSLGAAAGMGLNNTIRNCRSLAHNNGYYEAGTLYYREKITGAVFAYDIFTDLIISRSIPFIRSCSMRTGYSNVDGLYIGLGATF